MSEMRVTLQDIKEKFDNVINGTEFVESAAMYAQMALNDDEVNKLDIEKENYMKIIRLLVYMTGMDLKNSPDEYFHCMEDFIDKRREMDS